MGRLGALAVLAALALPLAGADPAVAAPTTARLFGLDIWWEIPDGAPPTGLLLLLHGCRHAGSDFWPPSPACPACLGLGENVRMRALALARGLAVVAPSSSDRRVSRCWSTALGPGRSIDGRRIPRALAAVAAREGLAGLPVVALGVSNGAAFALMLPHFMPLAGVIAQVRTVPPEWLALPGGAPYPPTLFVYMPRTPTEQEARVGPSVAALLAAGGRAAEMAIVARPVTAAWVAERIPEVSAETAAAVVGALADAGWLDAGGFLTADPRGDDGWRAPVRAVAPALAGEARKRGCSTCRPSAGPLAQLLNVAFAEHEITTEGFGAALDWTLHGGEPGWAPAAPLSAAEAAWAPRVAVRALAAGAGAGAAPAEL